MKLITQPENYQMRVMGYCRQILSSYPRGHLQLQLKQLTEGTCCSEMKAYTIIARRDVVLRAVESKSREQEECKSSIFTLLQQWHQQSFVPVD